MAKIIIINKKSPKVDQNPQDEESGISIIVSPGLESTSFDDDKKELLGFSIIIKI